MRTAILAAICFSLSTLHAFGACDRFVGSTTDVGVTPINAWRADYPAASSSPAPWKQISFDTQPAEYMNAVLSTARTHFRRDTARLVGSGNEPWWISEWMDYDRAGREPLMGLTKERGPRNGDLSPSSKSGSQVWAVGFYNDHGSTVFSSIFADRCNPAIASKILFPEDTVSIKFLFTDANLDRFAGQVAYLDGAPTYTALIDAVGRGGASPVEDREKRNVQLLQLDIAVKDARAANTGWVFGTFVWVGPTKGDGLFDNLVPVSLQWGNDANVYTAQLKESWINPDLNGVLFGWNERPSLGFNGRANGPADNIRSSCLSCHAAARTPRSARGLLGSNFNLADLSNPDKVKEHVDLWFRDIAPGDVFDQGNPDAVAALDYSLQLESAIFRMCSACEDGAMTGKTPDICITAKFYTEAECRPVSLMSVMKSQARRAEMPLPRQ